MARGTPHILTFILLTAMTVITTNMFLPALPAMQDAFGVSEAVIGLSISAYMAAAALLQIVLGPVSDRVGRRPVILGVLAVYVVASMVCVLAQDIVVFLLARVAQAVAVAGGVLASAMVRDLFDGRVAAAKLATISSAMAIAPMVAPVLGGALEVWFDWRAIFVAYALLGFGLLLWCLRDLGETHGTERRAVREPMGALMGEGRFWAYALCQSLGVGTFFTFLTGAPFVAAAQFGLNAAEIGYGLGSITLGFLIGAAVSARIVGQVGPIPLIFAGRVLPLVGLSLGLVAFAGFAPPVWAFFAFTITVGLGNGLTLANANAMALSVRPKLAGTASGVVGALGNLVGAALTALATAVVASAPTPERLLMLMIGAVLASLLCALMAVRLDRAHAA